MQLWGREGRKEEGREERERYLWHAAYIWVAEQQNCIKTAFKGNVY